MLVIRFEYSCTNSPIHFIALDSLSHPFLPSQNASPHWILNIVASSVCLLVAGHSGCRHASAHFSHLIVGKRQRERKREVDGASRWWSSQEFTGKVNNTSHDQFANSSWKIKFVARGLMAPASILNILRLTSRYFHFVLFVFFYVDKCFPRKPTRNYFAQNRFLIHIRPFEFHSCSSFYSPFLPFLSFSWFFFQLLSRFDFRLYIVPQAHCVRVSARVCVRIILLLRATNNLFHTH